MFYGSMLYTNRRKSTLVRRRVHLSYDLNEKGTYRVLRSMCIVLTSAKIIYSQGTDCRRCQLDASTIRGVILGDEFL